MNNQEREAFEQTLNPHSRTLNEVGDYASAAARDSWDGFQAGAAYQRSIDKGLVEALEQIGFSGIESWAGDIAVEALAAYRAAQEGK